MAYTLSAEQLSSYHKKGYLKLSDVLSAQEKSNLVKWAQEVHDLPRTEDSPWMPYEELNDRNERVLCRTENFANYHDGFNSVLRGSGVLSVLTQLAGEDMVLFKEKINYKFPGSGGFGAHIDSPNYRRTKDTSFISVLFAVDRCDMSNGGLEFVDGSHLMSIPILSDGGIEPSWTAVQEWTPAVVEPGELVFFGSELAHRSAPNNSPKQRMAVYATYNRASEGDLHERYYEDRAKMWPATHKRREGVDYEKGAKIYAPVTPMGKVDVAQPSVAAIVSSVPS